MGSDNKPLILVVDDELHMVRFVRMNLELEGYRVIEAHNGMEAIDSVKKYQPDLIIMDVAMPVLDGFEALRYIRQFSQVPVILLTVKDDEEDIIKGLELGADDYVTKPFSPRILMSRVKAVLRRSRQHNLFRERKIKVDDWLTIDFSASEVIVNGKHIKLRPTEKKLLMVLVENAGWVMPQESLLVKVWGPEYREEKNLIRLYITYLRKKIEPDPSHPRYILTERGVGYKFVKFGDQS